MWKDGIPLHVSWLFWKMPGIGKIDMSQRYWRTTWVDIAFGHAFSHLFEPQAWVWKDKSQVPYCMNAAMKLEGPTKKPQTRCRTENVIVNEQNNGMRTQPNFWNKSTMNKYEDNDTVRLNEIWMTGNQLGKIPKLVALTKVKAGTIGAQKARRWVNLQGHSLMKVASTACVGAPVNVCSSNSQMKTDMTGHTLQF